MEENEVMQTEAADSWDDDYLADETFVDEGKENWDDDSDAEDEADQLDESEEAEAAEEDAEEESSEPETETQSEEEQPETEAKSFKLKHLDEEVEVDETKVVELAQKGMDYDRIREKYDALNADSAKYKDYEAFLSELAAGANQTIEELIDSSRARMLIAKEKSQGRSLSENDAREQVRKAKEKPAEPEAKQPDEQEVRRQQFRDLIQAFPDIKADEIPKEVFERAQKSGNLFVEYSNYRMNLLAEENKKLKQEQKNRQRATGSMQSKGTAPKKDKFDSLWYDGT